MRLRHAASLALTAGIVVATSAACLDDPPPATTCPPLEPPATDCTAQLASLVQGGCGDAAFACLRPSGCACPATECAPSAAACWPAGDCPPAVTSAAPAGTSCRKLETANATQLCPCGCPRCVSECDGHGVPIALLLPPTGGPSDAFLRFDLGSNLPGRGRLGLYARIRGQVQGGAVVLAVTRGGQPIAIAPANVTSTYSDSVARPDGTTWQSADTAPTGVEVRIVTGAPTPSTPPVPAHVAVEIDCIIPFVEPIEPEVSP